MNAHEVPYVILVVEDDPDHAALIEAVFSKRDRNAYVRVTRTAEEAVAFLAGPWPDTDWGRGEPPDIIVLDVLMPGMGGLGFLDWYSTQDKLAEVPVVVFTSSDDPDLARRCFALGAREFKTKPTDFTELVDVVHRVLDRWRPGNPTSGRPRRLGDGLA